MSEVALREASVADAPAIKALITACFGPERPERAAVRLRAAAGAPAPGLSLVAVDALDRPVAAISFWPLTLIRHGHAAQKALPRHGEGNARPLTPALLLGPLAVDPVRRGEGHGKALVRAGLTRARQLGHKLVMLVGDADYYGPFGFSAAATDKWLLPGEAEHDRILALSLDPALAVPPGMRVSAGALEAPGSCCDRSHEQPGDEWRYRGVPAHIEQTA